MGNSSTKESRSGDAGHRGPHSSHFPGFDSSPGAAQHPDRPANRRNRVSRGDLGGILGLGSPAGSSSRPEPPYERRETRQEREARRLERERVTRIAERERSIREEHVDGGYLVTMGTYTGPEDFNKQIVRQLQIERKIAPFWRGLNDFSEQWTEPQIIAAARGLPIPAAGQTPPEELIPRHLSADEVAASAQSLNSLTVPIGGRTQSATSEQSVSHAASGLTPPTTGPVARTGSPFKPRGKALAAVLGGSSRNGSTTEIVPREINLPNDPFVNGQPLEVFLYKDAIDCPICFLSYPPYLNHTRCCDQAICSECFVQIKRPDPHFPEGHNENDPNTNPEESAGLLVSEPACCPYCTQPEFGVTYEPPPFRRGLAYSIPPPAFGSMNTAMSSNSSLNSGTLSPTVASPLSTGSRRRTHSLSATAHNVILTDRIRPEWATKLQAARAHLARRSAAATALHTAAFLMGNADTRGSRTRFGRRNTGGLSGSVSIITPNNNGSDGADNGPGTPSHGSTEPGPRGGSTHDVLISGGNQRSRIEDLEDMMFMEAIRLSLASEEERKRKAEKEERKEAKKREKEDRKAAKAVAKQGEPFEGVEGRSGHSSASGSSLSLPFGRKRGNSGASNLRVEASVASAMASSGSADNLTQDSSSKDKGKGVDRSSLLSTPEGTTASETGTAAPSTTTPPRPIPSPHQTIGPSHLRQMSSASSVSSSILDSQPGSYISPSHIQDPRSSGLSLGSRSGASEDGGDQDRDRDPSASTEPMFNFRSLAEVVGVSLEGEHAGRRLSQIEAENKAKDLGSAEAGKDDADTGVAERVEDVSKAHSSGVEISISAPGPGDSSESHAADGATEEDTGPTDSGQMPPPKVTITPGTPGIVDEVGEDSKQLGYETTVEHPRQVTQ